MCGRRGGDTFLAPSVGGQRRTAEDVLVGPDFIPECFVSVKIKVLCEIDTSLKSLFEGWEKGIRCLKARKSKYGAQHYLG